MKTSRGFYTSGSHIATINLVYIVIWFIGIVLGTVTYKVNVSKLAIGSTFSITAVGVQ